VPGVVGSWVGAAVLTVLLHELAHWGVGTLLGNEMAMSLNTVRPVRPYAVPWHGPVVTAAGPVFTVAQAAVGLWVVGRVRAGWAYPFVLAALVFRGMALVMNLVSPNDEGRLSEMAGLPLFVLPLVVCAVLLWVVVRASERAGYGWRANVLGAVGLAHAMGALILLDQTLSPRLL
jgi:hypothetical protein